MSLVIYMTKGVDDKIIINYLIHIHRVGQSIKIQKITWLVIYNNIDEIVFIHFKQTIFYCETLFDN